MTAEEFFKVVDDFANTYDDTKLQEAAKFCANRMHRTGQQRFTKFVVAFIEEMAKNGNCNRFDERNKSAVQLCQVLQGIMTGKNTIMPCI